MDYGAIDREISQRVNAIYTNPKRHEFRSEFDEWRDQDLRGRRGGRILGRKRVCVHCGGPLKGHAGTTEPL